jgi:hypothetical protein
MARSRKGKSPGARRTRGVYAGNPGSVAKRSEFLATNGADAMDQQRTDRLMKAAGLL